MAGKHTAAGDNSALGANYYPGGKVDRAYAEGRLAGRTGAVTGTDDTSVGAATMTDSTASFTIDALIGLVIINTTNGGFGEITDNTATVVTADITPQNWDSGDGYSISGAAVTANPHDGTGSDAETAWDAGLNNHAIASAKGETAA